MTENRKLLIVEDDRDVKWIYDHMLHKEGFVLINAYNGEEAVVNYKTHCPDLVLMDIHMPVKMGDVAIREIREYDPGANIVAVTAYSYSAETLGVPVLRKGFRKEELLRIIEATLNQ